MTMLTMMRLEVLWKKVTGSGDHTLRIWSAESFECIETVSFDDFQM